MSEILGWTIVEVLGTDEDSTLPYSREIHVYISSMPQFSSKEEAELYLAQLKPCDKKLEVVALKPLRSSLPYQVITRRVV